MHRVMVNGRPMVESWSIMAKMMVSQNKGPLNGVNNCFTGHYGG